MTRLAADPRPFIPGTTGWTAADLDDPRIEREWFAGQYEIVEGVLTIMPPAYFVGGHALSNLLFVLDGHARARKLGFRFATEVDVVVNDERVARIDAAMMTPADRAAQARAAAAAGRTDVKRTRVLVPPTLAIEVISPGHESHDRRTKRHWYATFGVPHYWILDPFQRSLSCLVLVEGVYRDDWIGRDDAELRSPLFPDLIVELGAVWDDDHDDDEQNP